MLLYLLSEWLLRMVVVASAEALAVEATKVVLHSTRCYTSAMAKTGILRKGIEPATKLKEMIIAKNKLILKVMRVRRGIGLWNLMTSLRNLRIRSC